jgi:putative serine protease PepD
MEESFPMSQTPEHDIDDANEPADHTEGNEPTAITPVPAWPAPDAPRDEATASAPSAAALSADAPESTAAEATSDGPAAAGSAGAEPTAVLPAAPEHTSAPVPPGLAAPTAPQHQFQAQHPFQPQPPAPAQHPFQAPPAPFQPEPNGSERTQTQAFPAQPGPAQFPPAQPAQPAGYFGSPGVPPNWATPTAAGLPPYGGPGLPGDPATAEDKPKKQSGGRIILAAAVIAALVGAAVGAGVTYALKGNSSSTSLGSANNNSASSSLNSGSANATAVTAVAAKIVPSVVTITVAASDGSGDSGTGIIISSGGQILTNNHVISAAQGTGASLTVTFSSGKITQAKILGADPSSDLAVIQAAGVSGLTPATLGDSSTVAVGQQVVAIGEPLGLTNTVTSGIVSALNRPVAPESDDPDAATTSTAVLDAIQTDAPINPGNSGGPLINLQGQVIGIDSAIASDSDSSGDGSSQAGSIGLGFAIPINQAKPIAQELIKTGSASHSLLGVSVQDPGASATHTGATVTAVTAGGPAATAGLKTNDIITAVDNQQIADAESLVAAIRSYQPGTTVTLTYLRGTQSLTAQVTLTAAAATNS